MSEDNSITVDPSISDPTNAQIKAFGQLGFDDLSAEDLATPAQVKFLLMTHRNLLVEKRSINAEIDDLNTKINELNKSNSDLKIDNARLKVHQDYSWIEILISILIGYAVNSLATEPTVHSLITLILGIGMLLYTRFYTDNHKDKD